jgi:hypothetical protein
MSDPDLLLNLALDELQGEKLVDDSVWHRNAINHGAALVEDKVFGRCLELKGGSDSYVQLGSMNETMGHSSALTVMLWIKPAVDKVAGLHNLHSTRDVPRHCLLELAYLDGKQMQVLGFSFVRASQELIATVYHGNFETGSSTHYHLKDERLRAVTSGWIHLTFVKDATAQQFYLNGVPFSTYASRSDLGGNHPSKWSFLPEIGKKPPESLLGKSQTGVKEIGEPFAGCVAHLHVYKRALAQEEINWHIKGDPAVQYRYRITHPIDFSLENRDADPTLFMDGHPEGQNMFLRVNNVTGGVVQLGPPQDIRPSETDPEALNSWIVRNCHFELAFRPGTLEVGSINKVKIATSNSSWEIASRKWTAPDDRDSLYVLCKDGRMPDAGLILEVAHMLPDARYGTRTTLVDFRYKNLKSGSGETISGSVQQNLDLVNHLGRRNIPLHVGFVGSNLVLNNNDKPTELRLRVTNVLQTTNVYDDPGKSVMTGILRFDEKSEFLLSVDERPNTDWALNKPEVIKDIRVRYGKGEATSKPLEPERVGGTEEKRWQWKIPLKDLSLGPGEHLEIRLEKVKAAGSDGHSNLYLDYRDVPGYWNGRFTTVIEKAPLIYRNGKVGIGVEPETELQVKGTLKVDSLIVGTGKPAEMKEIQLPEGWSTKVHPRYFKDAHGMVHLIGRCTRNLPASANALDKMDILIFPPNIIFTLPIDFAPDLQTFGPFYFPARVQVSSRRKLLSWRTLIMSLRNSDSCQFTIQDYPGLLDELQEATEVSVYLDGISYPAKS